MILPNHTMRPLGRFFWLALSALFVVAGCGDEAGPLIMQDDTGFSAESGDSGDSGGDGTLGSAPERDAGTSEIPEDAGGGSSSGDMGQTGQIGQTRDMGQTGQTGDDAGGTAPAMCGNGVCEAGESCNSCPGDCPCPVPTHETEFISWNLYNNAGCESSNGVAKWYDRNNGPGPLSIQGTLQSEAPAILALQEDGKLGPSGCGIGVVKDKVANWLSGTHDVRSTDDVAGSAAGERFGIFIRKSKYRFVDAGYKRCYHAGNEVRGFMWAEVDLIADNTSNHFYVLNAHFKARGSASDIAERASQAQCVIDWVNTTKASHPFRAHFLLGDLNSGPDHNPQAYAMLTGPGGPFENTSTAGDDQINTHGDNWIDHVLGTKGDFIKGGYRSWIVGDGQVQNGGKLSDHVGLRTRIGHLR